MLSIAESIFPYACGEKGEGSYVTGETAVWFIGSILCCELLFLFTSLDVTEQWDETGESIAREDTFWERNLEEEVSNIIYDYCSLYLLCVVDSLILSLSTIESPSKVWQTDEPSSTRPNG